MAILRPFGPYVTVSVRFFAGAQSAAGVPEETVTLAAPATLPGLVAELTDRHGEALARVLAASSFIVDEVASTGEVPLADGTSVDVLPPLSGG